jgi:hypothetical protein
MSVGVRTPGQIIDAMARQRGLVTPVPPYFPLGYAFTRECIAEAYRDVIDVLTDAARQHAGSPEATAALKAVTDRVAKRLREE